ncbi:zinc finger and SCAN domain-containing protein 31 [Drosophila mojavensis]|uniref:Uncharacterized protein n=1 Tax=Drosophila mojavensis TaxID=7230 RepID=B4KQ23_DROMO|nr:zinc finger and SCAN domain-containing protein 31 [Drosophila mojavensis]EDW08125.1 uncharacterized protein Dmoj_GI19736 [Drosophila mojavensis]
MEEEIMPAATTNGMTADKVEALLNEKEAEACKAAEEEEALAEEGNAMIQYDGQAAAVEEQEEEHEKEVEEEMGEAEYLEDEMPDEECESEGELTAGADVQTDKGATATTEAQETTVERETETVTEADVVAEVDAEAADVPAEAEAEAESAVETEAETEADDKEATVDDVGEEAEDEAEQEPEEQETVEDEVVEELVEEAVEAEDEGELITGDDAQEEQMNISARSGALAEEVDEVQCRVCTSKDQLISLFTKTSQGSVPVDMLLLLCPSVSIALKDFMPQFICSTCLQSLNVAIKLRQQLESTEKELRKRLSRSKNKVRRPRGYVVIDAPVSDSASEEDEEELNDDAEFKVSDVAGSTSADSDSADTDISEKRRPGRRRGRKKGTKRSAGGNSQDEEHQRKRSLQTSPAASQGPFECDQCDLSFPRKQSYVMHRKMHDARHEFHCQICNKKFKVRGAYKTHMERHASERAQFRCELCSQVFRLRAELKRHMALSHDEHGIIYECKRCQLTFLTQTRLQRHQSTDCNRHSERRVKRQSTEGQPSQGRDLFKSVAPLTTTYWSDSFSD